MNWCLDIPRCAINPSPPHHKQRPLAPKNTPCAMSMVEHSVTTAKESNTSHVTPPSAKAGHRRNSHQPWRRRPGFTPTTNSERIRKKRVPRWTSHWNRTTLALSPLRRGLQRDAHCWAPMAPQHLHTHTAYFKHTCIARRIAFAFPAGTCTRLVLKVLFFFCHSLMAYLLLLLLLRSKEVKARGVGGLGRPVSWNHVPGWEGPLGGQCGELHWEWPLQRPPNDAPTRSPHVLHL